MKRTALLISFFSSIFLTVFLWNSCPSFVKEVGQLIYSYDYRIPSWILFHGVFALSFGLIPFLSFLIWRCGRYSSTPVLIVHSLFTYLLSLFISGYIFLIYAETAEPLSPWLPDYAYSESHWGELVMNYVIPSSVLIPMVILLVIALVKRKKITESEELDQSAVS